MDPRRNSGSYARPTSQFNYDQHPRQHSSSAYPPARAAAQNDTRPVIHVPKTRKPDMHHPRYHPDSLDTRRALPDETLHPNNPPISPNHAVRHRSKHGLVSERSPLQRLEGRLDGISKEEKRARIEHAEHRAHQQSAANQSRRVHTSGPQRPPTEQDPGYYRHERRHSSAPVPVAERGHDLERRRPSLDYGGYPAETINPDVVDAGQKFRRASDALRMQNQHGAAENKPLLDAPRDTDQERSFLKSYRHRARDAGFAGAAAAASVPGSDGTGSRQSSRQHVTPLAHPTSNNDAHGVPLSQQQLHSDRMGAGQSLKAAVQHQDPDPLPPHTVKTGQNHGPAYTVPPQTAGGQDARNYVGFASVQPVAPPRNDRSSGHHHGISNLFHRHHQKEGSYRKRPELQEWRQAGIARLTVDDFDVQDMSKTGTDKNVPWWDGRGPRRSSAGSNTVGAYDGPYDEPAKAFRPPLFLKCGPLLRYTGMRREKLSQPSRTGLNECEIWRGTVMIVTEDEHSSYQDIPTLRLFAQSMDLLPPLSSERQQDPPDEYLDPIAGQVKVSRTGQPLYVRPVQVLDDGVDVSRVENETGLFELTRSLPSQQHIEEPDNQRHQQTPTDSRPRVKSRDGEKAGKYREVKAARLHTERGVTFWRFSLEIELGSVQARVAYRINRGPAIGFWVPGRGESMNIMFHSCNGFSLSVNSNEFTGPDPLWRDVLNKHHSRPFHVMLGGGDQIYNDAAMRDTTLFKEWLQTKNPEHKHRAQFSEEMQNELEVFYLNRYSMWFSQGLFGMANSQIPMVNIWDDHDIIDVSCL